MLIVEAAGFAVTILLRRMTILRTVTMGYSVTPDAIKFYLKTAYHRTSEGKLNDAVLCIGEVVIFISSNNTSPVDEIEYCLILKKARR